MMVVMVVTNLPHKGLDATRTAIDLVEGDLADDLAAMFPRWPC